MAAFQGQILSSAKHQAPLHGSAGCLAVPGEVLSPPGSGPAKRWGAVAVALATGRQKSIVRQQLGGREPCSPSKPRDLWLAIICFGAPQPRVLCGVTCKNKSINPNQSPIIHPRPQFSQQRSRQGLSTQFELIPLSSLIRGHESRAASPQRKIIVQVFFLFLFFLTELGKGGNSPLLSSFIF